VLKTIVLALSVFTLITACSSKEKEASVIDTVEVDGAGDIGTQALRFDPMGSDSGNINGLSSVNFEYDQFALSSDARSKLAANAEWLSANPGVSLQVEGHCDSRGSIEYNLTLGERRANAVKAYLVSLGVDANRLSVISYGEEKPVSTGDGESDHYANRRANFVPIQ